MMSRTQISLTGEERRILDEEATRTGRSIASLIRQAVRATYGETRSTEDDVAAMRRAFGSWQGHDSDGEQWVESLRSGSRVRPLS